MTRTNKFIAIEGLDGSGKSTQIGLLIDYLKKSGVETKFVHFPRSHEGVFGELIAKFLRGEFGDSQQVHPQLVALLFAEDRKEFASTIKKWLEEGYFVLVDRYVLSNIAFQCAKIKDPNEKVELRDWINRFEYEYNKIPQPDLSIYLDVPFSFTKRSLAQRRTGSERGYLNGKDDIHEKDTSLQLAVKEEYENLIKADKKIHRIICYTPESAMKPVADIHNEIVECIHNRSSKTATPIK
jgi:dTMP kinase